MPHSDYVPPNEELIYNDLSKIRQELSILKRDHTKFMNSKEINQLYKSVLLKVKSLNNIRKLDNKSIVINEKKDQNKVDILIDEIFQLLSLCFVTCGLTKSAPSTYASLSTVHRLLEHINESEIFTHNDLLPIKERLQEISDIINNDNNNNYDNDELDDDVDAEVEVDDHNDEIDLLKAKLNVCMKEYKLLEDKINQLPKELEADLNSLVLIKRSLMNLIDHDDENDNETENNGNDKNNITTNDDENDNNDENDDNNNLNKKNASKTQSDEKTKLKLFKLKTSLQSIEINLSEKLSTYNDNDSIGLIKGLIDDCHNLINDLEIGDDKVDPELKPIYTSLINLKSTLENLLLTRRWTLRTTDIFNYQRDLKKIDDSRVNGLFVGENSTGENTDTPKKGQVILLYLLRRCFAIIYKLLESSEPVSESLQPLHNQLSTVRRCLLDLKRMGVISSLRELYPYQLKLSSIDNLRKDGKFIINNQIPEGQGTLSALLAENFDILHELKIEYYDHIEENESESKTDKDGETNQSSNDNDDSNKTNKDNNTTDNNKNSISNYKSKPLAHSSSVNIMGTKAAQHENYNYNNDLYDDTLNNDMNDLSVVDYDNSYQNSILGSEEVTDIDS